MKQLDRLELAFDAVKKQLFSQLHNVLRSQLFDRPSALEVSQDRVQALSPPPVRTAEDQMAAENLRSTATENLDSVARPNTVGSNGSARV